jgi:hypothetical protein
MPDHRNAFEQLLFDTQHDGGAQAFRGPLIDVADTMHFCKKWFESQDLAHTGADVVAMAALVLEREARGWKGQEAAPGDDLAWMSDPASLAKGTTSPAV